MIEISISKQAVKFLENAHPKNAKQIARKLMNLRTNPLPFDSIQLKGIYSKYRRADIGEYRIIYFVDLDILYIVLIGKRNDNDIYKILTRNSSHAYF
jgi:mRNA interferase RelE/StbE